MPKLPRTQHHLVRNTQKLLQYIPISRLSDIFPTILKEKSRWGVFSILCAPQTTLVKLKFNYFRFYRRGSLEFQNYTMNGVPDKYSNTGSNQDWIEHQK